MALVISEEIDFIKLKKKCTNVNQKYTQMVIGVLALFIGFFYYFCFVKDSFILTRASIIVFSVFLIVLTLLKTWSIKFYVFSCFQDVPDIIDATHIYIQVKRHQGKSDVVPLEKISFKNKYHVFFQFQKLKYFHFEQENKFKTLNFFDNQTVEQVLNSNYYKNSNSIDESIFKFGNNNMHLNVPPFLDLFKERILSPMFVYQFSCCMLWFFDDYWMYSIFCLAMLIFMEGIVVIQQKTNMATIRQMQTKPALINVYRSNTWNKISSDELLPGDIVSLTKTSLDDKTYIPCDILLLHGTCLIDESVLTGESTPQIKEPVEQLLMDTKFEFTNLPKVHCLSAGTVLLNNYNSKKINDLNPPDKGAVGICIETGFTTTKGKLLKTILYGSKDISYNNFEMFVFFMFLTIFAGIASAYVWIKGSEDPNRNQRKLFVECILILTAAIPSELPLELSMAVNSSLLKLFNLKIFCTEPFRIPFAGKLDVCCFDKTGTLTKENLIVEGIVIPKNGTIDNSNNVVPINNHWNESTVLFLGCHSLVQLEGKILGDPFEKSCLEALNSKFIGHDSIAASNNKLTVNIVKRFAFQSKLKRMSALLSFSIKDSSEWSFLQEDTLSNLRSSVNYMCVCKGAPEIIGNMLCNKPDDYETVFRSLTMKGYRVLSLGFKIIPDFSISDISKYDRAATETELYFGGFLVARSPLKDDSIQVIRSIKFSAHRVVMITGDNPLTACHVAIETGMIVSKKLWILEVNKMNEFTWSSPNNNISETFNIEKNVPNDVVVCLLGASFRKLIQNIGSKKWLCENLEKMIIFSRVDPEEKETIITLYKDHGLSTLMCGDGTNDIGALRQADLGIAILNMDIKSLPKPVVPIEAVQNRVQTFAELRKKLAAEMTENNSMIKLGDASIAAPFTSKEGKLQSVLDIIIQGRCTLITSMQMFRILAINSLIAAYSMSAHYSFGIRTSDLQSTFHGIIITFGMFFLTNTQSATNLSANKPRTNIFNPYMVLTVISQALIHLGTIIFLTQMVLKIEGTNLKFDLDVKFSPNVLNSVIYITSLTLEVTTLLINYQGKPYMQSLNENRKLRNSIVFTYGLVLFLLFCVIPDINDQLQIVVLSDEIRLLVFCALLNDLISSYLFDRFWFYLYGEKNITIEEI